MSRRQAAERSAAAREVCRIGGAGGAEAEQCRVVRLRSGAQQLGRFAASAEPAERRPSNVAVLRRDDREVGVDAVEVGLELGQGVAVTHGRIHGHEAGQHR